ncbi:MAG: CRTAC1 family protein [Bryobacteraceae bacterium]|nr:CRTAC1 family protein [Bryobacteraceae bacterium]
MRFWPAAALFVIAAAGQIRFEDVGARAGVGFVLENGAKGRFHQPELMAGGIAVFDYNNDGKLDLYFTNGAELPGLEKSSPKYHNRLYRNEGGFKFTDVTAEAGVEGRGFSMAAAVSDYDSDGYSDLFVAGVKVNLLYRNLGNGRFKDVTAESGLTNSSVWSISAGFFDYDNDGKPDLLISNYVAWDPVTEPYCGPPENRIYCHPSSYPGLPNQLFHNNGDGTFTDVSAQSGIGRHVNKGMGVAFGDIDGDGAMDAFVSNDSTRHLLFHNRRDGTFAEIALEAGVAFREDGVPIAGMGAELRDLDNDGLPDLAVAGMVNDTFELFRNRGKLLFEEWAHPSGLALATRPYTGWSIGAFDFDNDGFKDLFCALSHFPNLERYLGRPAALSNRVFRNIEGRRFVEQPAFDAPEMNPGAGFGDLDGDGLIDAVVSVLGGPAKILRNTTPGAGRAYVIRGKPLGTVVRVTLPNGRTLTNHATSSTGYACASDPAIHFGLGQHEAPVKVEIRVPGQ